MNKIDEAWALLKALPPGQQEIAADAILDFAAESSDLQLGEEQMAELRRRFDDPVATSITLDEFRSRIRKLGP